MNIPSAFKPGFHLEYEEYKFQLIEDSSEFYDCDFGDDIVTCRYESPEVLSDIFIQYLITLDLEYSARRRAREVLVPRILQMAAKRGLKPRAVKITGAQTRWGSCTSRGNINLSFYNITLPRRLSDYILQHELTHLIEMNHGPRFWAGLEKVMPDARQRRKELRQYAPSFFIPRPVTPNR